MELQEFKDELVKRLQDVGLWVKIGDVDKINYQGQEAVIVKENADDIDGISHPVSELYKEFKKSNDIDFCVTYLNEALKHRDKPILPYVMGKVKNKEFFTLHVCSANENRELLARSAYYEVTQALAAVAYIDVPTGDGCYASVRVNDNILNKLGMTKKEVLDTALSNLEQSEFIVKHIAEVIEEMAGSSLFIDEHEMPMYVVTGKSKMYGANILATKTSLYSSIADSIGEDCYILPSSIHEIILVPKSAGIAPYDLKMLVESVNETELDKREKLCDEVFEYSMAEKRLLLATYEDKKITKERGKSICRI